MQYVSLFVLVDKYKNMDIEAIQKKNYRLLLKGFIYGLLVGGAIVVIMLDLLVINKII